MSYPEEIPRVVGVEHVGDYRLRVEFDDGLVRELDFRGQLRGPVFEPLQDPAVFAQVRVDDRSGTVTWPNEVDLDPVVLHGDEDPIEGPPPRLITESRRPAHSSGRG